MAYVRNAQTVLPVEQARRLNAALRRELAELTAENAGLVPKVEAMRRDVTAARKKLARQIWDLDAIRTQIGNIAALAALAPSREPRFGGPEGLAAATAEIRAHKDLGLNLSKPLKGPSHGTSRRYAAGCRCEVCRAWRKRKSGQEVILCKRRRERAIAEALEQSRGGGLMAGYVYRGAGFDVNEPPAAEILSHDPAKCGTYAGYCQHFYYGTEPCTPCREANNTYKRSHHLRKPRKAWSTDQCGTLSGYSLHYRHGVPVCAECRAAQSAYQAGYRERKRAA